MNFELNKKGITVIMPTFQNEGYIERAITSLLLQTFTQWELIIIIDGTSDNTEEVIVRFLSDKRIRIYKNAKNQGLGFCLNQGIRIASNNLIAYLPSDDIIFKDHLETLYETMISNKDCIFAYSGVKYDGNNLFVNTYGAKSNDRINDHSLQLVQVLHLKTDHLWLERQELVTDDLHRMYWNYFYQNNKQVFATNRITCEWVDHTFQRHKIINEFYGGGIYKYKKYYNVKEPIRFHSSLGNYENEIEYFEPFRNQLVSKSKGLKILLVGDLSYNSERIIAFEERGHKLYGLWIDNVSNHTTIGPLPFGNVEDLDYSNWKERVKEIKPDIIYALSNYHCISLAHEVILNCPDIPFVWHLKEGPFDARQNGTWNELIDLYKLSDGQVYHNQQIKDWYHQFLFLRKNNNLIFDGELPKKEWFNEERSELLSQKDGGIHTVFVGRPVGLQIREVEELIDQNIHLHFYGEIFHRAYKDDLLDPMIKKAPKYIHLHPYCTPSNWVKELSCYDAGWLHIFKSENQGELLRSNWLDLNSPARMATYAMAGLPMIQKNNSGNLVASQTIIEDLEVGVFFDRFCDLGSLLSDKNKMNKLRDSMWEKRMHFCYDTYVDDLLSFFYKTIKDKEYTRTI